VNVDTVLVVAALILAIVSLFDQRYPLLPAAVICLAVALLI